jgi:integrase
MYADSKSSFRAVVFVAPTNLPCTSASKTSTLLLLSICLLFIPIGTDGCLTTTVVLQTIKQGHAMHRLQDLLAKTPGWNRRTVRSVTRYVKLLLLQAKHTDDDDEEEEEWLKTAPPSDICSAWKQLRKEQGWTDKHMRRVRSLLVSALRHFAPDAAQAIRPLLSSSSSSSNTRGVIVFDAPRSAEHQRFALEDCLPGRLRHLGPLDSRRCLIVALTDRLVSHHLRSVSRQHVQKIARLIDALVPAGTEREEDLRGSSARDWLCRLDDALGPNCHIGFPHFKRLVRIVSILHSPVICGKAAVSIPVPSAGGRIYCSETIPELGTVNEDSYSSTGTDNNRLQIGRQAVREKLSQIRDRVCGNENQHQTKYATAHHRRRGVALRPDEVRRVLEACTTTQERLIMLLFLTTGLRVGGVARLQLAELPAPHVAETCIYHGYQIPAIAQTIEKGNHPRQVTLTSSCRILIARWLTATIGGGGGLARRDDDSTKGSHEHRRYVFPAGVGQGGGEQQLLHVSTRQVHNICVRVCQRAGICRELCHPHTLRHTVVHLLYMSGMSFDAISKWIGHSSPNVTSGVYGQLAEQDIQAMLVGVPFMSDTAVQHSRIKREWTELAEFIHIPFVFRVSEWDGLTRGTTPTTATAADNREQRRQAVLAAAAAILRPSNNGRGGSPPSSGPPEPEG